MTALPFGEPICVRINDAARMIGIDRTKLYELIAAGEVEAIKLGKSTRIAAASLHDLIKRQCGAVSYCCLLFRFPNLTEKSNDRYVWGKIWGKFIAK